MDVDQLIQMGLDILRYWGCFIACLAPADCPAAFPLSALPYLSLTEESLFVHSIASFTVEGIVNLIFAANTCAGEIGGKPPVLADHPISTRLMRSTALPLPCSRLRTAPV